MPTPGISVGNVQIQALLDVHMALPLAMVFSSVPADDWASYRDLYPWAFNNDGTLVTNATCYLLRSAGRTVLLDMGLGAGPHENLGGVRGALLDNLAAAGVTPDAVDTVVLTHLHGDHIGWAMSGTAPTFPKARVLVGEADWTFFNDPSNPRNAALQNTVLPLHASGMIELVSGEHAITEELTMLPTPGHTPGHYSLLVRSQGQGAILTGDVVHSPAQITETDWSPSFDTDGDQAAESRWTVVQRADVEGLVVAANHFPFPGFGRIVRISGRRGFERLAVE